MQTGLPSTFFTQPPEFRWLIILYFFVGGLAGGALMIGSLIRLLGQPQDRPLARIASHVAVAGALVSGVLLIVDLGVPLRFRHMMIQNHTGALMFKWWSPMSVGVWGLLFFSGFAALASADALAESGDPRWQLFRRLGARPISVVTAIGGVLTGLFLAGYTGVLLSVSNRPIWADSSWLGLLFLLSGVSTAAAALILLARQRRFEMPSTIAWLARFDWIVLGLELVVLACFLISLGDSRRALMNAWSILLLFAAGVGILYPLRVGWPRTGRSTHNLAFAAICVLVGGFLLRVVVLLSSESVHVLDNQVMIP